MNTTDFHDRLLTNTLNQWATAREDSRPSGSTAKKGAIILLGPMGVGKSKRLVDIISGFRFNSSNELTRAIHHDQTSNISVPTEHVGAISCATTGDNCTINSRNGTEVECEAFKTFGTLKNICLDLVGTIVIDEAQFITDNPEEIVEFLEKAEEKGVRLVFAGLGLNINGEMFESSRAICDSGLVNIIWLEVNCDSCGCTTSRAMNLPIDIPVTGRIPVQYLYPKKQYIKLCQECRQKVPKIKVLIDGSENDDEMESVTKYLTLQPGTKLA